MVYLFFLDSIHKSMDIYSIKSCKYIYILHFSIVFSLSVFCVCVVEGDTNNIIESNFLRHPERSEGSHLNLLLAFVLNL